MSTYASHPSAPLGLRPASTPAQKGVDGIQRRSDSARGLSVMLLAADPLADFIDKNPTVVMLALGFLLMIGAVLIADGFGVHVPKGYIYAAMAFSALVEGLNMWSRNAQIKKDKAKEAAQAALNKAETAEPGV